MERNTSGGGGGGSVQEQLERIIEVINKGNSSNNELQKKQMAIQERQTFILQWMSGQFRSVGDRIDSERTERIESIEDLRLSHRNSFHMVDEHLEGNSRLTNIIGSEIDKLWAAVTRIEKSCQSSTLHPKKKGNRNGNTGQNDRSTDDESYGIPPILKKEKTQSSVKPLPVPVTIEQSMKYPTRSNTSKSVNSETVIQEAPKKSKVPKVIKLPQPKPAKRKQESKTTKARVTCEYCKHEFYGNYLSRHQKNTCVMAKYKRKIGEII